MNLTTDKGTLPLKQVDVDITVINLIAQFTVHQRYFNDEDEALEASYTFPTPANATVYDFNAQIGDKLIKAILKDKDVAHEEYNKAISQGNGAYMMDKVEGDVFNCCIGNVPPKTEIKISIKYAVELKTEIDSTRIRVNFPLTIMPRYEGTTDNTFNPIKKLINALKTNDKPYDLSIAGKIIMTDGIISIEAKTSKIKVLPMSKDNCEFKIQDLEKLDEDIILTITRNTPKTMAITQAKEDLTQYRYATMVNIVPDFSAVTETEIDEIHYTLILDRSGSMRGEDLDNCKKAATFFVSMLPVGSTFDIYHFGSYFERFNPDTSELQDNMEYKKAAIEWINKIQCQGGTSVYPVLLDAYNRIKNLEKSGTIIFISDGGIMDTNKVLQLVKNNASTSVFTIGIGSSVSQSLINGMAEKGNGKAEFINSKSDEVNLKVIAQLKRAQQSIRKGLTNNVIDVECDGTYKIVPEKIGILFENDNNTAFIYSDQPLKSISYAQQEDKINVPMMETKYNGYLIHRMMGNKLIEEIKYREQKGSNIPHLKTSSPDTNKTDIIEVSTTLGILSEYTTFIGVEQRTDEEKTNGETIYKEIPLQQPKKYSYGGFTRPQGPYGSRGVCGISSMTLESCCVVDSLSMASMPTTSYRKSNSRINPPKANLSRGSSQSGGRYSDTRCANPRGRGSSYSASYPVEEEECEEEDADDGFSLFSKKASPQIIFSGRAERLKREHASTQVKPTYSVKYVIDKALPKYNDLGNGIISANENGLLPAENTVTFGDYIKLTAKTGIEGIYRVISMGSEKTPWVIEFVSKN